MDVIAADGKIILFMRKSDDAIEFCTDFLVSRLSLIRSSNPNILRTLCTVYSSSQRRTLLV